MSFEYEKIRSTTIIAVKKDGKMAMAGDGQVTMGNTVMKGNAKVRRMLQYCAHWFCRGNSRCL